MTILVRADGWEEYQVLICPRCKDRLHQPGSADFALYVMTWGSCGHQEEGDA